VSVNQNPAEKRLHSWIPTVSHSSTAMAGKKAQRKKQETTLVPHRTPNLSVLLEKAKTGESATDVAALLSAGGSAQALVETADLPMPLLHYMALYNQHSHRELAESMRLLLAAGADINLVALISAGDNRTALMCAPERDCCTGIMLFCSKQALIHACVLGSKA
jgi:formyltetrahydrofolate hydrolase